MIFNGGKIYAKVWKVTRPTDKKYFTMQISTYEKNQDNEYTYSSWFPRVIGHAFNSLKDLKEGDRVVITKSKFTNEKYTAEDGSVKSVFRFLVLEANIDTGNNGETIEEPERESVVASEDNTTEAAPALADQSTPW